MLVLEYQCPQVCQCGGTSAEKQAEDANASPKHFCEGELVLVLGSCSEGGKGTNGAAVNEPYRVRTQI